MPPRDPFAGLDKSMRNRVRTDDLAGGVLRSLQERGLIEVVGRSEALGRPLLYGTTPLFLELLGLRDLADLPKAEELTIALRPHRAVAEGMDDAAAYVEAES